MLLIFYEHQLEILLTVIKVVVLSPGPRELSPGNKGGMYKVDDTF